MTSKAYDKAAKFLDDALCELGLTDDSPYDHANQSTTEPSYGPDDGIRFRPFYDALPPIRSSRARIRLVTRQEWARERGISPIEIEMSFSQTTEEYAAMFNIPLELITGEQQ